MSFGHQPKASKFKKRKDPVEKYKKKQTDLKVAYDAKDKNKTDCLNLPTFLSINVVFHFTITAKQDTGYTRI